METLTEIIARGLYKHAASQLLSGGGSSFSKSVSTGMSGSPLSRPTSMTEGSFMSSGNRSRGDSKPSVQDGLRGGPSGAGGALRKATAQVSGFPSQKLPQIRIPGMKPPNPPALKMSAGVGQLLARGLVGGVKALGVGAKKGLGMLPAPLRVGVPLVGAAGAVGYAGMRGKSALEGMKQARTASNPALLRQQEMYDTFRYGSAPQQLPLNP